MKSYLSTTVFGFMEANNIKPTKDFAEKAGVGLPWLRSWYVRKGKRGSNILFIEAVHDYCVSDLGMTPLYEKDSQSVANS